MGYGTQQGFPQIELPLVDKNGKIQQAWLQFLIQLWGRTGGTQGQAVSDLQVLQTNSPLLDPESQFSSTQLPPIVPEHSSKTNGVLLPSIFTSNADDDNIEKLFALSLLRSGPQSSTTGLITYYSGSASSVALTTSTPIDLVTLNLPAGTWDVTGSVYFAPSAITSYSYEAGWISKTSSTMPTPPNNGAFAQNNAQTANGGGFYATPVGTMRLNLTAPSTPVYLSVESSWTGGTISASGFMDARLITQ